MFPRKDIPSEVPSPIVVVPSCEEEPTEEEPKEEPTEGKRVEAFDLLTDKWAMDNTGEISMKDVDDFVTVFKSVPIERREECLQRALNLIPDNNVMVLLGILFDKSVEKEFVQLVFDDVLNRDESVKMPVLQRVYKDCSHPCWDVTAWILDCIGKTQNQ